MGNWKPQIDLDEAFSGQYPSTLWVFRSTSLWPLSENLPRYVGSEGSAYFGYLYQTYLIILIRGVIMRKNYIL